MEAVSAPVDCDPLVAFEPDQPPVAVQEVALVADHVRDEELPLAMELGFAVKLTAGAAGVTETVVDWLALPPDPVQAREKVELAVRLPVDCEPLVALVPDHAPNAAQEVALPDAHVRVDAVPLLIVLGLALRVTVTVALALTVTVAVCTAVPPGPEHVNE